MKTREIIFAVGVTTVFFAGCVGSQPTSRNELAYPYTASPEREAQILRGIARIEKGMTPSDVKAIMGDPDQVRDLFNSGIKNAKPIGYTWWYIIRRKTDQGSFADRAEQLVRVSFDLNDKVTKVDFWGIKKPSDNNSHEGRTKDPTP